VWIKRRITHASMSEPAAEAVRREKERERERERERE
jgi:hypothetical protein